jgi:hypothetical protein
VPDYSGTYAYDRLMRLLTTKAGLTPQVAGRQVNDYARETVERVARGLWEAADSDYYTPEEKDHLKYAARWMGYEPTGDNDE